MTAITTMIEWIEKAKKCIDLKGPDSSEFTSLLAEANKLGPDIGEAVAEIGRRAREKPKPMGMVGRTLGLVGDRIKRAVSWSNSALGNEVSWRSLLGLIVAGVAAWSAPDSVKTSVFNAFDSASKAVLGGSNPVIAEVPGYRPGQADQGYFSPSYESIQVGSCVNSAPKIDGDLSDWTGARFFGGAFKEPWASSYFFTGAMMVDDKALYIAARVGDPKAMQNPLSGPDPTAQGAINVHLRLPNDGANSHRYVRMILWHRADKMNGFGPNLCIAAWDNTAGNTVLEVGKQVHGEFYNGPVSNPASPPVVEAAPTGSIKRFHEGDGAGYDLEYRIPWSLLTHGNTKLNPFFDKDNKSWKKEGDAIIQGAAAWEILWLRGDRDDEKNQPIKVAEVLNLREYRKLTLPTDATTQISRNEYLDPYEDASRWGNAVFIDLNRKP